MLTGSSLLFLSASCLIALLLTVVCTALSHNVQITVACRARGRERGRTRTGQGDRCRHSPCSCSLCGCSHARECMYTHLREEGSLHQLCFKSCRFSCYRGSVWTPAKPSRGQMHTSVVCVPRLRFTSLRNLLVLETTCDPEWCLQYVRVFLPVLRVNPGTVRLVHSVSCSP